MAFQFGVKTFFVLWKPVSKTIESPISGAFMQSGRESHAEMIRSPNCRIFRRKTKTRPKAISFFAVLACNTHSFTLHTGCCVFSIFSKESKAKSIRFYQVQVAGL